MSYSFDIGMVVPGLPFDGDTLKTKSLGGSETAALYMAKELQKKGAQVLCFTTTENPMTDDEGVRYLPIAAAAQYTRTCPHDVLIVQRVPEMIAHNTTSRLNILWQHDLAVARHGDVYTAAQWNVDKVFVLSDFMADQYAEVYGANRNTLYKTRNGIDTSIFKKLPVVKRDRFHLVYAARPERGLDVLLERVMPRLIELDPRYHLTVCGYDNTVEQWREFYERCWSAGERLGSKHYEHTGQLTKEQLAMLYRSAGVYVYPTPSPNLQSFAEVSCISAMECQAAGLPIVTSEQGALSETIAIGAGVVVPGSYAERKAQYIDDFVGAVHRYATNDDAFVFASKAGTERGMQYDWSGVADDWLQRFDEWIRYNSRNADTVIMDMYRKSDIVAAKQWLKDDPDAFKQKDRIEQLLTTFDFMDQPDGYREQYERIGSTHDDWVYGTAPREPRFALLRDWLQDPANGKIETVLDYGCAHGAYAIGLAKQIPSLKITGVDIDHYSTDMATHWAAKLDVADRAKFEVWTHDQPSKWEDQFDCALLQEVLEHVPQPWEVIQNVERTVRPGGKVYITVPFGPWEYSSYHNYPWRCHIWHFDKHDLIDMIGGKQELVIDTYFAANSPEMGDPMGWWILSYNADHKPIGKVNVERKRWLCKPRETVSACLIAGGDQAVETLMWNLRSLYHVADEIVIADCGAPKMSTANATDVSSINAVVHLLDKMEPIARWKLKVRVIEGMNPKNEGFERARNHVLDAAVMDWILWIDTDEKLLDQHNVHKYLRNNAYNGYGVRQHHLAIDVGMKPDMPVRFFRRGKTVNGDTLRFFGALHEHPERALNDGPGPVIIMSDVHIAHIGYLNEGIRQRRFERNYPLLQKDIERYPDRKLQKFFLMRDKIQICRFEMSQNGNKVTPEIRAMCREVVAIGQEHFVGKGNYMNSDALEYYSEALAILGEGFDVAFQIEADKVEAKPNGAARYRFASKEDFEKEFRLRMDRAVDPLLGKYY